MGVVRIFGTVRVQGGGGGGVGEAKGFEAVLDAVGDCIEAHEQ